MGMMMASMAAGALGGLAGYRRQHVLRILFLWNLTVFFGFVLLYRTWGLHHMDLGEQKPSWHLAFYFAALTHYSFTPPFEPKDAAGRTLVALHSTLSWVPLFLVVFAPGSAAAVAAAASGGGGGRSSGTNPGAMFV